MKKLYELGSRNGWRWGMASNPIAVLFWGREKHKRVLKVVSKHPEVFMFTEGSYQVRKVAAKKRGKK